MCDAHAFSQSQEAGEWLVATMTATLMALYPRTRLASGRLTAGRNADDRPSVRFGARLD